MKMMASRPVGKHRHDEGEIGTCFALIWRPAASPSVSHTCPPTCSRRRFGRRGVGKLSVSKCLFVRRRPCTWRVGCEESDATRPSNRPSADTPPRNPRRPSRAPSRATPLGAIPYGLRPTHAVEGCLPRQRITPDGPIHVRATVEGCTLRPRCTTSLTDLEWLAVRGPNAGRKIKHGSSLVERRSTIPPWAEQVPPSLRVAPSLLDPALTLNRGPTGYISLCGLLGILVPDTLGASPSPVSESLPLPPLNSVEACVVRQVSIAWAPLTTFFHRATCPAKVSCLSKASGPQTLCPPASVLLLAWRRLRTKCSTHVFSGLRSTQNTLESIVRQETFRNARSVSLVPTLQPAKYCAGDRHVEQSKPLEDESLMKTEKWSHGVP